MTVGTTDDVRLIHPTSINREEWLQLIQDSVHGFAIVIFDIDGTILNWNVGAVEIMGWTQKEAIGADSSLFFTPEDIAIGVPEREMAYAATSGTSTDERLHVKKDGSRFWASGYLSALRDRSGRLHGYVKIMRDATEQKKAREELGAALAELTEVNTELREAYAREQRNAEVLQRSILLNQAEMVIDGVEIATHYEPAMDDFLVGGDFCDVFWLPDQMIGFVVGDVVGKGIGAAAQTAQIKFALRVIMREYPQPAIALDRLNAFLCESAVLDRNDNDISPFTAMCVGILNPSGTLMVSGAGIEPPLIIRADGNAEPISTGGMPVGVDENATHEMLSYHLEHGDILLLTTDGITEARDGAEFLGYEGMAQIAMDSLTSPSLKSMADSIVLAARDFGQGAFRDDVCLMLIRRR